MKNSLVLKMLALLVVFASCKKIEGCTDKLASNYNAEAVVENSSCVYPSAENYHLQVMLPVTDSVYENADTVRIKAEISSEEEIHGYSLSLVNSAQNLVIFSANYHVHQNPIFIDTFWVSNESNAAELALILTAIVNHEGAVISDTVRFKSI